MTPAVTVLMPVYNGAEYLPEAIASVLEQSMADFELVVVDDGSTDATGTILADFAGQDARVRVQTQENSGQSRALNAGLVAAHGELVAILDADDVALPERLALQTEFLRGHPDVGVVGGAAIMMRHDGTPIATARYPTEDAEIRRLLERRSAFVHSAVTVRRELLQAAGGYRAAVPHAEDYDLWLRLSERTRLANLDDAVVRYRLHPDQVSVRALDQQAVSHVAAHVSRRARLRGHADPLDSAGRADRRLLAELGVDPAEVAEVLTDSQVWWARTLTRAGYEQLARSSWRGARTSARGRRKLVLTVAAARLRFAGERRGRSGIPLRAAARLLERLRG